MNDVENAIKLLSENGIPLKPQAYGFSLQHTELPDRNFAECGMDNDGSISISVNIDETPPVQWFFRISYTEMAAFIVEAYKGTSVTAPSRKDIVASMRQLDESYDRGPLEKMTAEFLLSF